MGLLSSIFGGGKASEEVIALLEDGAIIIDVRTPAEFAGGSVANAKNIPLQELEARREEIIASVKPVVFCCASGNRSGQATEYFKSLGLQCENGGSWTQVKALL